MGRPYTELQVLKKLDIPDFRHLTKDKIIAFASMIPRMDPEVAKKALEQFPDFTSTSLDIMKEYRGILEKAMEDDRESTQACYDMYNRIMNSCEEILHGDELTFDEKKDILEQMIIVASKMSEIDHEKANNRLKIIGIASGVAVGITALLGSILGSNLITHNGSDSEDDE